MKEGNVRKIEENAGLQQEEISFGIDSIVKKTIHLLEKQPFSSDKNHQNIPAYTLRFILDRSLEIFRYFQHLLISVENNFSNGKQSIELSEFLLFRDFANDAQNSCVL